MSIAKKYKSYSELLWDIENTVGFDYILSYDTFSVVYDKANHRYFYFEEGENDASDFCEVRLVARLTPSNEMIGNPDALHGLFPSICCGEAVDDLGTCQYMWFDKK